MGTAKQPAPVKLVVGMLAPGPEWLARAEEALEGLYGAIDYRSAVVPFTQTHYYARELGDPLWRRFVAHATLIDPGELAAIKVATNAMEQAWAVEGKRRVNLDPGYMALGTFVLATTKDQAHRVYLGQGIYGEVTLAYRDRDWRPWPWTYPDYQSPEYRAALREIRARYAAQLKGRT